MPQQREFCFDVLLGEDRRRTGWWTARAVYGPYAETIEARSFGVLLDLLVDTKARLERLAGANRSADSPQPEQVDQKDQHCGNNAQ